MNLKEKLEENWKKENFPSKDQIVLVAVSGGMDSMALADLLYKRGQAMAIAHCNFKLRVPDCDIEEELVIKWGYEHQIKVHHISFDTQLIQKEQKTGIQETARKLRYDWFKELCQQYNYVAIATAHHAQDNAETLLINFCKGTGIAGLHGISVRNNQVIRPLLFAQKEEIKTFVEEEQIPFLNDASNESIKYLRNAVRHKIIPALEEVFPNIVNNLNDNIQRFKQIETIYRNSIRETKAKIMEQRGKDYYIPILKLLKTPAYESICFEIGSDFGFHAAQIPEILKLLKSESGRYVASSTHHIIRNRDFLIITAIRTPSSDFILIQQLDQTIENEQGTIILSSYLLEREMNYSTQVAYLDAEKLKLPLIIRRWRAGDYFYPLGMEMKKKKISRFLIEQKIPIHEKENIWVLENNKQIVWIVGMRQDERFKIQTKTKKVVEIQFLKK